MDQLLPRCGLSVRPPMPGRMDSAKASLLSPQTTQAREVPGWIPPATGRFVLARPSPGVLGQRLVASFAGPPGASGDVEGLVRNPRSHIFGRQVGCVTTLKKPPYTTSTYGGVGGRGREAPPTRFYSPCMHDGQAGMPVLRCSDRPPRRAVENNHALSCFFLDHPQHFPLQTHSR